MKKVSFIFSIIRGNIGMVIMYMKNRNIVID